MSRNFLISFVIAIGVHMSAFSLAAFWGGKTKEAEVHFDTGRSAIKWRMLPSISQKSVQAQKQPVKTIETPKEIVKNNKPLIKEVKKKVEERKIAKPKEVKLAKEELEKKKDVKLAENRLADKKKKGVNKQANLFSEIKPEYPPASERAGHEGTAIFLVEVLTNGRADNLLLVESSGYSRLDNAAKEALLKAEYSPAMKEGEAVVSKKIFRIKFEIKRRKR